MLHREWSDTPCENAAIVASPQRYGPSGIGAARLLQGMSLTDDFGLFSTIIDS
jgi:hypothetical protein